MLKASSFKHNIFPYKFICHKCGWISNVNNCYLCKEEVIHMAAKKKPAVKAAVKKSGKKMC